MLYKPKKERLWDTWIVPYQGKYYLFYIRVSEGGTRWDGISLALSEDLLHWEEYGTVLTKHPDAIWLGTGMIQRIDDHFIMNFSEERPAGRQVICFARSEDLLHWERLEEESLPDSRYYLTADDKMCDFMARWDSIGIDGAPDCGEPPYYGFVTASAPADIPGHSGAVGLVTSEDGVHWQCLPCPLATRDFNAYEVPEHLCLNGRHYLIFSVSDYLGGRRGTRARFLEGGVYYVVSDQPYSGYTVPPGDPLLLGTRDYESPCMKTVGRLLRQPDGEILLYYQWGELNGDGWVGVPLLLSEAEPWRLQLRYWPGAEALKGEEQILSHRLEPVRKLPEQVAPCVCWEHTEDALRFTHQGSAGGVWLGIENTCKSSWPMEGIVLEGILRVDQGLGAGFLFDAGEQHFIAHFNFRDSVLEFGWLRDGWAAGVNVMPLCHSKQRLGYALNHRVRLLVRNCFVEVYLDDVYADGFRFEAPIQLGRIGFVSDQASGLFGSLHIWKMNL